MWIDRVLIVSLVGMLLFQGVMYFRGNGKRAEPLIQIKDAPPDAFIELGSSPVLGERTASVFIVEFSDYECPFCAAYATSVFHDVKQRFIESGRARYTFVNAPLSSHTFAKPLAGAAICAGKQDRYWEMHQRIFTVKPKTSLTVREIVSSLGLDVSEFTRCTEDDIGVAQQIREDLAKAEMLKVPGTPSFGIGRAVESGRIHIRKLMVGLQPLSAFEDAINEMAVH